MRSPASGELLGAVRAATAEQVDQAVAAAAAAFESWRRTSVLERVEICRRALRHLHGPRRGDRAHDHPRDRQDDPRVARGDGRVHRRPLPARGRGRACATPARCCPRRRAGRTSGSSSSRSPSASSPRSRPGTSRSTSPASRSSTGSPSAARPSGSRPSSRRSAPSCSSTCCTRPASRRAPSTSCTAAATSAPMLTRHRDVASVVFTGSVATGEKVAREAGLKNRILELGGNGPQIVLADANLEAAADAAVMGCFYLAGQVCTAAERVLVHRDVHDRFVELLIERTEALRIGDPLDEATDMGPMCNSVTLERTQAAHRRRRRARRRRRPRRRLERDVPRADDPHGRHERDGDRAARRRSGRSRRSCASTRSTRRSRSATRPSSGSRRRSSRTR